MKYLAFTTLWLLVVVASSMAQTTTTNDSGLEPTRDRTNHASAQADVREADVREAVLRYQVSKFDVTTYCVEIAGKDADKDFLKRFYPLPVKKASECKKQTPEGLPEFVYSIVDKKTNKPAVILDIGDIRWINETQAEVDGGYHCAAQCMAGGSYRVVWDGTRWIVKTFRTGLVS